MHKDHLLKVAKAIEADGGRLFDMRRTGRPESGISGCIKSWTRKLMRLEELSSMKEYLGLSPETALELFEPEFPHADFRVAFGREGHIPYVRAAAQLRRLAETGEVRWTAA